MPRDGGQDTPFRALGRLVRAVRLRFAGPRVDIVYSPEYSVKFPGARNDPRRAERILSFLSHECLVHGSKVRAPRRAAMRRLRRVHEDTYLDSLQLPGSLEPVIGYRVGDADEQAILEAQKWMVGGTLLATKRALERGSLAVNLGGGLHHAMPERGAGFCAFNDMAVAIREARHRGFQGKVLVVDLDLHDGDGTRAIFSEDTTVHTLSVHNRHWGSIDAVESTSVELGDDVTDDPYLSAVSENLDRVLRGFEPDLVYFLAGCDPAEDDTLGNWRITDAGMLERDRTVLSKLRRDEKPIPAVLLLAGGYGKNAWRYTARTLSRVLTGGTVIEPPTTGSLTMAHYRKLAKNLRTGDLVGEPSLDGWSISPEDILPDLTQKTSTRFIGFYSRHGLEVALERYGFLPKIRALGFHDLRVTCDFDEAAGDTVRIFAHSYPGVPVAEIRLRRDTRLIEGMELLHVEWLRLQNPALAFSHDRPELPGQYHPGIGLLRDTTAILVMACERLGLDGLSFVAGHYHLVVQSHKMLGFLRPEDEERFHEFHRVLKGKSLSEASRIVDHGGVIDLDTGKPAEWVPPAMVVPVSERLKDRIEETRGAAQGGEETPRFRFALVPEETD